MNEVKNYKMENILNTKNISISPKNSDLISNSQSSSQNKETNANSFNQNNSFSIQITEKPTFNPTIKNESIKIADDKNSENERSYILQKVITIF